MAIDFTKYIPSSTKKTTKSSIDFSKYVPKSAVTSISNKVSSLPASLGGGQYNVGKPMELVTSTRAYGGTEAPGQYREHIFPVALGGTSNIDNIKVYGKDLGVKKSAYENEIIKQYKSGKITLPEARGLVLKKYRELTGLDPTQLEQTTIGQLPSAVKETVGGFLKGLVTPFVEYGTSVYNVAKQTAAVTKAIKSGETMVPDYLSKSYTIPVYGKTEPMFTGKETNKDLVKKVVGNALEIAPYFIGIPEAKGLIKTIDTIGSKSLSEITTKEATQFAKAYATKVATDSLGLGTMFGAGSSIKEGSNAKQTAKNIAKSVATVALLETTLSPIIKYGLKLKTGNTKEVVDKVIEDHKVLINKKVEEIKSNVPKVEPVIPNKIDFAKYIEKTPEQKLFELEKPRLYEELNNTVINIPQKGVYAKLSELTPEQFKIIKNEVESIPFTSKDIVHLSSLDKVINKQKEISLEDIKGLSFNAKTALDNIQQIDIPSTYQNAKVSGVAKNIESKAIEQGMIDKGINELPEYDSSTVKKQAELGSKYTTQQLEEIARTGNLPEGMKPATPLSILEDVYKNNPEKLIEIAKSPLTSRISESASELSLSRMRDKGSAVEIIKEVIKGRREKFSEDIRNETKKLKEEVKKTKPSKDAWLDFVESIKC